MRVEHDRSAEPQRDRQRVDVVRDDDVGTDMLELLQRRGLLRMLPEGGVVAAHQQGGGSEGAPAERTLRRREVDELVDGVTGRSEASGDDPMVRKQETPLAVHAWVASEVA